MPEAHTLREFFVPLPEHEAKSRERGGDAEESYEEKKTEQDEIEQRSSHPIDLQKQIFWRGDIVARRLNAVKDV